MSRTREYEGEGITVRYDVGRCVHARECLRGLPAVFDAERRPWVDAGAASADDIARAICRCPSGALTFERTDGGPPEPVLSSNVIRVDADGPLYVSGDIELTMPDGTVRSETRLALCRCGESRNKPYCDNTHRETGFTAASALGESKLREEDPADARPSLRLSLSPNGSLRLLGPVTIEADSSEPQSGSRGSLCRCGDSENKPYCDGTHKRNGFEA